MGESIGATKNIAIVEQKVKKRSWLRNVFRLQIEIDGDKLMERMGSSAGQVSKGGGANRWSVEFGGVVDQIKAQCKLPPDHMPLSSLTLSIWCDVPKGLWDEFSRDSQFIADIEGQVREHMRRMIREWAIISDASERQIPTIGVEKAVEEFRKNSEEQQKEWEAACIDLMTSIFREKAKVLGNYRRYKVKAGAKLFSTMGGIAISIAGLATAATPAAPATLIPAIIGLVSSVGSCINQFRNLALEAGDVREDIEKKLASMRVEWKDPKGKWNKKTMKAVEAGNSVLAAVTGDLSEIKCPTISGLLDKNTLMGKKTDGLEVRLHDTGIAITNLADGLQAMELVLTRNRDAVREAYQKKATKEAKTAIDKLEKSIEKFTELTNKFGEMFDEIPERAEYVKQLREDFEKFQTELEKAQQALGTKNIKLIIGIFYSVGTIGAAYASPPDHIAEKITASLGTIQGALDGVREYTEPVMEALRG